ncbi:MAG: hypothetical protein V1772_13625, partial [Chloroflexota bacterium]
YRQHAAWPWRGVTLALLGGQELARAGAAWLGGRPELGRARLTGLCDGLAERIAPSGPIPLGAGWM